MKVSDAGIRPRIVILKDQKVMIALCSGKKENMTFTGYPVSINPFGIKTRTGNVLNQTHEGNFGYVTQIEEN